MQARYRGRILGASALLLLLITAGIAVTLKPTDPSLLSRATRITPLPNSFYIWRTSRLLLFNGLQHPPWYEVLQLDCTTGKIAPISILNRNRRSRMLWRRGKLSSDGNWILYQDYDRFEATPLEQGQRVVFPGFKDTHKKRQVSNTLWCPDSRRFVYLGWDSPVFLPGFYVVEHRLDPPGRIQHPAFGFPRGSSIYFDVCGSELLGFVGQNRLLALAGTALAFSKRNGGIRLYEVSIGPSPKLKEYALPLPSDSRALAIALSPEGKRFALLLRHYRIPPLSPYHRLLGRWWPHLLPEPKLSVVLYTLRIDGTEWRDLGHLPAERAHDYDSFPQGFRLQWLPDGERLSFIHQDALWTVPVEKGGQ